MPLNAVSVIAYSPDDPDMGPALGILQYLVELALCHPFVAVPLGGLDERDASELQSYWIDAAGKTEGGLNHVLAARGALDVVRSLAVTSLTAEGEALSDVARGANVLSSRLRALTTNRVPLVEGRLLVPLTTGRLTTDVFFGKGDVVNLIALPEDEIEIHAIPVYADAFVPEQRAAHAAFEIATVAGIWAGMDGSPIDDWETDAAGTPATRASFVSSAARVILDTSPDLGSALDVSQHLPVPPGFLPLPSFPGIETRVSEVVFPPELEFSVPTVAGDSKPAGRLDLMAILREFGRLPTYAWRSVTDDVYDSGQENLREILFEAGFEDVKIEGDAETGQLLTEDDIEAIIASAEHEASKPRPNPIPGEYWRKLIATLLAVLDGGRDGVEARTEISSETQVLTEQARIVVPGNEVDGIAAALTAPERKQRKTGKKETSGSDAAEASGDAATTRPAATGPAKRPRPRTVLMRIGDRFRDSLKQAHADVPEAAKNLRSTGRELTEWQQKDILGLIPWVLALVAFLLGFSIIALTPVSGFVADLIDGWVRPFLFGVGAAFVLVLSGLAILGRSGPSWQRNATLAAVVGGLLIGVVTAFADQIIAQADDAVGIVIGIIVIGAAVLGIAKAKEHGHEATARAIRRSLLAFLALIVIFGATRPELFIQQDMPPETQHRLATALIIAAFVMAAMSAVIVAIARLQQTNAIKAVAQRLEAGRHRLIVATDATRRLDSAIRQWGFTGSSLNYVIQYPFGRADKTQRPDPQLDELGLLRFQILALELGRDGKTALIAGRLRSATGPGWLLRQYDTAVETFAQREARLQGLLPEAAGEFRPDEDEEPLTAETSDAVKERARRVMFARWVNDGDADPALAAPVMTDDLVEVYRNVLEHEDNYRLRMVSGPRTGHTDSMPELFHGIVPDEPRLLSPELVTKLFGASDESQRMNTTVWWPSDLAATPPEGNEYLDWMTSVPFTRTGGTERLVLQAIRFDRSASFAFHELAGATDTEEAHGELDDVEM